MAAIFSQVKYSLKLGKASLHRYSVDKIFFAEIALSGKVFEIQAFLCFAFLKKIRKFKMATIFGK